MQSPTYNPNINANIIIIGGGVIGCAIAYYLARSGVEGVLVLERDLLGQQSSGAAAGMLAPLAESEECGPFVELGLASLRLYPLLAASLHEETGIDIQYRQTGMLKVALSEGDAERLQRALAWQSALGMRVEWLDTRAALALEPTLAPTIHGAVYSPDEHHVYSPALVQAFSQAAARRGVAFLQGQPAVGLMTQGKRVTGVRLPNRVITCNQAVIASGAWSAQLGEWLGVRLPIFPIRGQILALRALPSPITRIIYTHNGYLVPKVDGSIILGATEDEAGFDHRPTAAGIGALLTWLPQLVPSLSAAVFERAWGGLRPASADTLPLLGPLPGWAGVTVASGHFRNGILLSPITGKLIAAYLSTGAIDPLLRPFGVERFAPSRR